ncbi:MAG: hypothetical protein M0Z59_02870 [Nitrospiraceae bacterium]|nr:hypothetical protein [Nitrospiraceae bacterium]
MGLGARALGKAAQSVRRLGARALEGDLAGLEMGSGPLEILKLPQGETEMKKLYVALVLLVAMLVAAPVIASAQPMGINARIVEQQKRIRQGITSGELTRREAGMLRFNLRKVKLAESDMRARTGGYLTDRQRIRLNHMLDVNSNMIYRKKHNGIRRF